MNMSVVIVGGNECCLLYTSTLVGEAKSHRRTLAKRAAREVTFSDLSESELAQLFTTDEYESEMCIRDSRCYAVISAKRFYPQTGSYANRSPAAGKPI